MSQPDENLPSGPSQQNDSNQPGEICLSELINSRARITERKVRAPEEMMSSPPESGQINDQNFEKIECTIQRDPPIIIEGTHGEQNFVAIYKSQENLSEFPIIEELPSKNSSLAIQEQTIVLENQIIDFLQQETNLERKLSEEQTFPIEEQLAESPKDKQPTLPSYLIPNYENQNFSNRHQNPSSITDNEDCSEIHMPLIQTPISQVILEPPIKITKNCSEDLPEIKLSGKNEDFSETKVEPSSNGVNFGFSIKEKVEYSSNEINFNEFQKSAKKDSESLRNFGQFLGTKNVFEKNQLKETQSSDLKSIKELELSNNLLQEFKNQAYQIRNMYFQQESQTYQKYILNMQSTLQKEYEDCRLQSVEISNQNNIQSEIDESDGKDFSGTVKNEMFGELKSMNAENVGEAEDLRKFQNRDPKQDNDPKETIIQEGSQTQFQESEIVPEPKDKLTQKQAQKIDDLQNQTTQKASSQIQKSDGVQQLSKSDQKLDCHMSQTIEIHEEADHIDENDTPVFGNYNENSTHEIVKEQLANMSIDLETGQEDQPSQPSQTLSEDKLINQENQKQKKNDQEKLNSKLSESVQSKTISIDESEEEEAIFVPKKQSPPVEAPVNVQETQNKQVPEKLTAENVRKMLLEAETDWTDIIRDASESQILQFYQELTSRAEMTDMATQFSQEPKKTQEQLNNQQIQSAPLETIIEEPSRIPLIPQQTSSGIAYKEKDQQDMEILITALAASTPQLKEEIMKLSREQLLVMYKDMMEEAKGREEIKPKNKKKKNSQPIIDLEDENVVHHDTVKDNHLTDLKDNGHAKPSNQSSNSTPHTKSSFSYLFQYQKRKSETQKKNKLTSPSSPTYVNKTLLYQLIRSHDFEHKLKSIMMPKESIKYQEKTEKEIAMIYLNHLKKIYISKGPFESDKGKKPSKAFSVLCAKSTFIKSQQYKKVSKQGLGIEIPKLTEDKKQRILQVRQKRIQASGQSQTVPQINTLPSSIPLLPAPSTTPAPLILGQIASHAPAAKSSARRRYCLIVEEELDAREEEEIALQKKQKRVKKSAGEIEDKEIMSLLKSFEKVIGTEIELEE